MPAQSSTDFLTHTLRLCHLKNWMPSKSISGRLNLRGRFSFPKLPNAIIRIKQGLAVPDLESKGGLG